MKFFNRLLAVFLVLGSTVFAASSTMEHINGAASPSSFVPATQADLAEVRSAIGTGNGSAPGAGANSIIGNTCNVAWQSGLTYYVSDCTYQIQGITYSFLANTITIDAADGTNPRIDKIVVDNSQTAPAGTLTKITGTAAVNPSEPSVDASSQLSLGIVQVAAGATTPTGLLNETVYAENVEWTSTTGTGWNCNDTGNPHGGTKDCKATAVATNAFTKFVRSTTLDSNLYQQLNLWVAPVTWGNRRSLEVTLRDANGTQVGNAVTIKDTSFGFSTTSTAKQLIAIPRASFGVASGTLIKEVRLNPLGSGGTFTLYVDDIVFQSSTSGVAQLDQQYLPVGSTYALQEKGANGRLAASSWSANGANLYAANGRVASSSGALQLGVPSGSTPTILDSAANSGGSGGTTFNVTLPTTRLPGDLLLSFVIEQDQSGAPTLTGWPTGWSLSLTAGTAAFTGRTRMWVAYKVADGSETDYTLTATQILNGYATKTYRISNFTGTPEIATTSAASTANPDPPSLTPSWGSANNLWFAFTWFGNGTATASGFPSGYPNTFASAAVGSSYAMGIASRSATTASENPSTFTLTGAEDTGSGTLAIRPAGSGSTQTGATVGTDGSVNTVAGAANQGHIIPSASGTPVAFSCDGLDTNVDCNLVTKGSGVAKVNGTPIPSISTTDTLTNKTLDAEGTGNVITVPRYFEAQGAACQSGTAGLLWDTKTASAPTAVCLGGTNREEGYVNFPDSDGDFAIENSFTLPASWVGTIDITIWWKSASNSGNAAFQIATSCVAPGEDPDSSWNTAQVVTSAAQGTASRLQSVTQTSLTTTGCAASEDFHFRILRNRTHASDTLGASPLLFRKAIFKYRTAE